MIQNTVTKIHGDGEHRAPIYFNLGQVLITRGIEALERRLPCDFLGICLSRHQHGDWGRVCQEDKAANDEALREGFRILSVYVFSDIRIWIVTEADRSVTTILLPSEY